MTPSVHDTEHNVTQHNNITIKLSGIMLNVIKLSVIMLSVIMPNVVMLSVVVPSKGL